MQDEREGERGRDGERKREMCLYYYLSRGERERERDGDRERGCVIISPAERRKEGVCFYYLSTNVC